MLHKSYKLTIMTILLLLTTSCTAEYNINISTNKNINEELKVIETNTLKWDKKDALLYNRTPKEYLDVNLKWPTNTYIDDEINPLEPTKSENNDYYNKKNISNSAQLGIKYSYEHGYIRFMNSSIVNSCYDIEYNKEDNIIYFETKSAFKCFDKYKILDEVKVNLTTDCKVLEENADKNISNKYTWNITKANYISEKIKFKVDCTQVKKEKSPGSLSIIYSIVLYGLVVLFILLVIKIKSDRNNKF